MAEEILNFEEDVIERSRTKPVLVDFWAPWCGPCRVLGPVLERLAEEQSERWSLVKVNSDDHPDLSARFGIRGIPAVKLFVDGDVIDEFTGVLPDHAVRQWLDKALPSEAKKLLARAEDLFLEDRVHEARNILEEVLSEEPTNPSACALLSRLIVYEDPERATELATTAETGDPQTVRVAQAVKLVAGFLTRDTPDFSTEPGGTAYHRAIESARNADIESAITSLIDVLKTNRYLDDDGPKRLGVALFTLLGDDQSVTRAHRRTFDMWLY